MKQEQDQDHKQDKDKIEKATNADEFYIKKQKALRYIDISESFKTKKRSVGQANPHLDAQEQLNKIVDAQGNQMFGNVQLKINEKGGIEDKRIDLGSEQRLLVQQQSVSIFEGLRSKKMSLDGGNQSIVESKPQLPETNQPISRPSSDQIMRDAARAELEIEYIKKVEDSIKKEKKESRNQQAVSEEEMTRALSSLQLMTDQ